MSGSRKPVSTHNQNDVPPSRNFYEFAARPDNLWDEKKRHPVATQHKPGSKQRQSKALPGRNK